MELCNWMEGEKLIFEAEGTGEKIVEIAQQLSWLGAALRHSPDDGLKNSEAKISTVQGWKPIFDITFSMNPLTKTNRHAGTLFSLVLSLPKAFPLQNEDKKSVSKYHWK